MPSKSNLRSSENGRLADGGLRFVVRLPKDLADLFEAEMKIQDRKKLPLARYIIATYFKDRALRNELEVFLQAGGDPHSRRTAIGGFLNGHL
jgi:hypothetical protein